MAVITWVSVWNSSWLDLRLREASSSAWETIAISRKPPCRREVVIKAPIRRVLASATALVKIWWMRGALMKAWMSWRCTGLASSGRSASRLSRSSRHTMCALWTNYMRIRRRKSSRMRQMYRIWSLLSTAVQDILFDSSLFRFLTEYS